MNLPKPSNAAGMRARFQLAYAGFRLDVDLQLPGHGVTALFGPSGSGKTTCLRCVAGLEHASTGHLSIDGLVWQDSEAGIFVPTYRRSLGYVFQDANLFSHLTVHRNLSYGMRRIPESERHVSWDRAVDLLGIGHLLDRMPDRLSGGERQRVGMARALLSSPHLLLMDEPLAALDMQRRNEILPYLRRLHDELDIPILYVTHSPDEVARLADHLVFLDQGTVLAHGPLSEMLARLDLPTAHGEEAGTVIEAVVSEHDAHDHLDRLTFSGGDIWVAELGTPTRGSVRIRIPARDVSLATRDLTGSSILNRLPATITAMADADTPAHLLVRLDAAGTPLMARITRRSWRELELRVGSPIWAQIKSAALLG